MMSAGHPETFLLAATRLRVAPARCLVFEDAPHGIEAARAAGMRCVRVITETTCDLVCSAADREIPGFDGLDAREFVRLWS
jgi:beta-phosphoglucomutase-like phosphatase (HAD superfamily)